MDILSSYVWPGNVRELENALHYAFISCKGDTIEPNHLPEQIVQYVLFGEKRLTLLMLSRKRSRLKAH
jgi:DNA-binding NtrC family response regulator